MYKNNNLEKHKILGVQTLKLIKHAGLVVVSDLKMLGKGNGLNSSHTKNYISRVWKVAKHKRKQKNKKSIKGDKNEGINTKRTAKKNYLALLSFLTTPPRVL